VPIPDLQKAFLMLRDQRADSPQLVCREPEVPYQGDGPKPEFRRQVVAVNVPSGATKCTPTGITRFCPVAVREN
jgi:hypothetical protein